MRISSERLGQITERGARVIRHDLKVVPPQDLPKMDEDARRLAQRAMDCAEEGRDACERRLNEIDETLADIAKLVATLGDEVRALAAASKMAVHVPPQSPATVTVEVPSQEKIDAARSASESAASAAAEARTSAASAASMLRELLKAPKTPDKATAGYTFTMNRDAYGRLTDIVAEPTLKKE
jgi:hypothetical protein